MSEIAAAVRQEIGARVHPETWMPALLVVNTMVLFALDWREGIPQWIKLAANLFLQF
jgi:hypothetical protein